MRHHPGGGALLALHRSIHAWLIGFIAISSRHKAIPAIPLCCMVRDPGPINLPATHQVITAYPHRALKDISDSNIHPSIGDLSNEILSLSGFFHSSFFTHLFIYFFALCNISDRRLFAWPSGHTLALSDEYCGLLNTIRSHMAHGWQGIYVGYLYLYTDTL